MEDEVKKFTEIQESISSLSNKKIRLEERFKAEKTRLEALIKEITDKGYDPKKLSDIRSQKEEELKKQLEDLEAKIKDTQEKLNQIEV